MEMEFTREKRERERKRDRKMEGEKERKKKVRRLPGEQSLGHVNHVSAPLHHVSGHAERRKEKKIENMFFV